MSTYSLSELLTYHRQCVGDTERIACYARAIPETVKEGDVVADVGTGTGILAILACRAGARRVYAIEDSEIIEAARHLSVAQGLGERIIFLQGMSYDVALPEKADVLIAGHLHNFGLESRLLSSILDAQRRLLKPGASIIPGRVELFMVPIECPERYEREINFWNCLPSGIDYSSLRDLAVNTCYKIRLQESQFLAEPQRLASLELSQLKETYVSVSKSFLAKRSGTLHGVGGWCRAGLSENAILTTEPAARNTDWAQIFFPVSEPVSVHAGDRLSCSIDTNDGYTWRWQVEISAEDAEGKLVRRRFEHSTFLSHPFSEATLRHRRVDAVPRLSKKGEAALFLLGLCDGRRTIGEMQEAVAARYGECWVSHADIVAFVAGVLAQ